MINKFILKSYLINHQILINNIHKIQTSIIIISEVNFHIQPFNHNQFHIHYFIYVQFIVIIQLIIHIQHNTSIFYHHYLIS